MIERPAAALKELVENAIDAGARRIEVRLTRGGMDRIEVLDDGCGIPPEALPLAVERHCTSKLRDETLVAITTLGFRGEALPSIGAAARLTLTSRPPGADTAWSIAVEGGVVRAPRPAAGPPGTRVVVEDLFFATPARRKFLKSPRIEAGHAEAVLRRLALAAPHCAWHVHLDDRAVLELPRQSTTARACALLGLSEDALTPISAERAGMSLTGHIAGPAEARATASGQILLVNDRPVTDPLLRTAIRVAYRPVIAAGRHPVLALSLSVPASRLDVNVHPAKTELRFADEAEVRSLVIGTLSRALGTGAVGRVQYAAPRRAVWTPPEPETGGFAEGPAIFGRAAPERAPAPPPETAAPLPLAGPPTLRRREDAPRAHPLGTAIAQVMETYILAIAQDGELVLVDQHAAHERLTHERLLAQHEAGGVQAQRLLLPEVVHLDRAGCATLLERASDLHALGLECEGFGGAVLLRTLPALLAKADPTALLRDMADELAEHPHAQTRETDAYERRVDAMIARMACHGSIRAGRKLGFEEMDALLRAMEDTPRAATCSHGRPTWLKLSRAEFERMFGRRV